MTQPISSALRGFLAGEPPPPTDAEVIAARLMCPERRHEGAVRDVAARLPAGSSSTALWEALNGDGIVPTSWFHDPRRLFVEETITTLPSWEQAAALAADPAGVEAAEALARECCARVALFAPQRHDLHRAVAEGAVAWGVRAPANVLQLADSNVLPFAGDVVTTILVRSSLRGEMEARGKEARHAVSESLLARFGDHDSIRSALGPILPHNAASIAAFRAEFDVVRARGPSLPLAPATKGTNGFVLGPRPTRWSRRAIVYAAGLLNPWEPLIGLYKLGYALGGFMVGAGWAPILLCPPLVTSSARRRAARATGPARAGPRGRRG